MNMECWVNNNMVAINENVTLSATAYSGTPPFTYTFNFNNEHITTVTTNSIMEESTFSFDSPGNKTLTVGVCDASVPEKTATCNQYVSVDQIGPMHVVDFSWDPPNPMLGEDITFTNLTTAPPGVVLNYSHWLWEADLTAGNAPEIPEYVPYPEYVNYPNPLANPITHAKYSQLGSYPVTLTVSDMNGWQVSKTKFINFNSAGEDCIYFENRYYTYLSYGILIDKYPFVPDEGWVNFYPLGGCCLPSCNAPVDYYKWITNVRWTILDASNNPVPNSVVNKSCPHTCYEMMIDGACYGWFYTSGGWSSYNNFFEKGNYSVQCEIWNKCADPDVYNQNLTPSQAVQLPYYDVSLRPFKVVDCDEEIIFSLNVTGNHPEIWAGTINLSGEVLSGGTLHCVGHNEINMFPGFTAHQGSDFNAEIIPCPDCSDSVKTSSEYLSKTIDADLVNYRDVNFANPIDIYPNPTTGLINIALNQNQKHIEVEVKAMNGVAIVAKSYEYPGNTILDLSPYPKGIYLLTIKTMEQVFVEKIILQ